MDEVTSDKLNITAEQTHCGQYKPYGDSFRVWQIETDCKNKSEILEYCFTDLYKRRVPESAEYLRNVRYSNTDITYADYYFAGYYTLTSAGTGYKFVICEPYTD